MKTYKYVAFISYQRKDEEWAKWLHHQLEYYHLPVNLGQEKSNAINSLRPIFLDEVELAGGILSENTDADKHSYLNDESICVLQSAFDEGIAPCTMKNNERAVLSALRQLEKTELEKFISDLK